MMNSGKKPVHTGNNGPTHTKDNAPSPSYKIPTPPPPPPKSNGKTKD